MPQWTTNFGTPGALTGLLASTELGRPSVTLTWDASALGTRFWAYYIYRLEASGTFVRIGQVLTEGSPTYEDFQAPTGVPVTYQVTISNGWAEGAPDTASIELGGGWSLIDPLDASLVLDIEHVDDYSESFDPQDASFAPLGRKANVVVSGGSLAPTGDISYLLLPDERGRFALLVQAQSRMRMILKTPFGDTKVVKVGRIRKSRRPAGAVAVSFEYVTVE